MINYRPLVSVLITNYNCDRYLKEAIDSALDQTYSPIEIVVVDDGSTDDSHQVLASYTDKIIPIFKKNGGQASAINAGFAVSRGEIICSLDGDDVWLPTKVEEVVKAISNHPKVAIVYHKVQNIDRVGKPLGPPWPPYQSIRGNIVSKVVQTGGWWPWPPSTALSFSRTFLDKVMNIPEAEYRVSADAYLADLAPFWGEVFGIDCVLSLFRFHESNNWSNSIDIDQRSLQHYEVREKVLNGILENLGINIKISLTDHWPYQLLRYKLGYDKNLIYLSRLAFRNPWVLSIPSKLKTTSKLWLEAMGWGSSRL
jgi:glycosyltransferase involved in cell wall biosynthesis